jgi:hypothetical protein
MRQARKLSRALLLGAFMASLQAAAQTKIGGTPGPVNPNAYLQLGDSMDIVTGAAKANKGLLLPRVGLAATNLATPLTHHVAGMYVYNVATAGGTAVTAVSPGVYYNDGTRWVRVGLGDMTPTPHTDWHITGNALVSDTNFLGTTTDKDLVFKRNGLPAGRLGENNTAFGVSALPDNTGYYNVAVGVDALKANTIGGANVAVGTASLTASTEGFWNTALGHTTLYSNTKGQMNVAVGYNALFNNTEGNYNTVIGGFSLRSNISGNFNTAIGYNVLGTTLGSYNVGIGQNIGNVMTTGNNNIMIGININPSAATASNELNIGNTIYANQMGAAGSGNVSIGKTAPAANMKLDVQGNTQVTGATHLNGAVHHSFREVTTEGDFSINADDYTVIYTPASVASISSIVTLTLPFPSAANKGRILIIVNQAPNAANFLMLSPTVLVSGTRVYDRLIGQGFGSTSSYPNQLIIQSDGVNWRRLVVGLAM